MRSNDRHQRPTLRPHQARGLEWLMPRDFGALFWQMRLGKTKPAHRWAMIDKPDGFPRLVVCPLAVIERWEEEFEEEGLSFVVLRGSQDKCAQAVDDAPNADWYITNFEKLVDLRRGHGPRFRPSIIATMPWNTVLIDESTRIRRPKTKATRAVTEYLSQAKYRLALTGLPNPEGTEDFVTQMLFVMGGRFMGCRSFWEWRAKHMRPVGYEWHVKRESRAEMRRIVDQHASWLSKKDVGLGNVKHKQVRRVDLPSKITRALSKLMTDWQVGDLLAMNKLQVLTWAQRIVGGRYPDPSLHHDAKIDEVVSLANGELKGEPLVVWAKHTAEIHAVADALKKAGVKTKIATGATKSDNAATRREFQAGKFTALVAQAKCLQQGVSLAKSSTAIYYSNWHDLEIRKQSEERIEDLSKSEPLLIMDIVARDTIDEDVIESLNDKSITARSFKSRLLGLVSRKKSAS